MSDLVVFTHVFRTGGMAAYEYLKSAGVRVGRPTYENIVESRKPWGEYDILVVHAPFNVAHFIPNRNVRYVTFLREPHDRIISRYFSSQDPDATWDTMLEAFGKGKFFAPDNMMTRFVRDHSGASMMQGFWNTVAERPVSWGDFERAKWNLEHNYFFVGLTEWWEESMRWICRSFDWPLPDGRQENDNSSKHRPDKKLPDEIMEALYGREVFDAQLYWFGRELATDYLFR
jgi:hypothetical protein